MVRKYTKLSEIQPYQLQSLHAIVTYYFKRHKYCVQIIIVVIIVVISAALWLVFQTDIHAGYICI